MSGSSGIEAVRANRRSAIDELAKLWPTLSGNATGPVSAFGQYGQCDDFGKTYGYFMHGLVVTEDVKVPAERTARVRDALLADGWEMEQTLDKAETLRARKNEMRFVLGTASDRFTISMQAKCAKVSTKESKELDADLVAGRDALDVPGIPPRLPENEPSASPSPSPSR